MSGAAPLSGELCASLRTILPNSAIGQGYGKRLYLLAIFYVYALQTGLTETVASVCLIPPEAKDVTVGSAGRLLPGITARVVKPDGTLAGEGEQGELFVSGPSMALGYLGNEAA